VRRLWILLALGCSGSGAPDVLPPGVTITFPAWAALTDQAMLTVRGTATDDVRVASVQVNGVAATSADGFRTWRATVSLSDGHNALNAVARDPAGNLGAVTTSVQRAGGIWAAPQSLAVDGMTAFVIDSPVGVLYAVDTATGARARFSNGPFDSAVDVILDAGRGRLVVVDATGLVTVDRATGATAALGGSGPAFLRPRAIALDTLAGRYLVVDSLAAALYIVDPATGARVVLSGSGPAFNGPRDIGFDAPRNRALVTHSDGILAIDLATGVRSALDGTGPALVNPTGLRVGTTTLVVADAFLAALVEVDLSTGARSILIDTGLLFPQDVEFDGVRILVVDSGLDALLSVAGGVTSVVSATFLGTGPPFANPRDIDGAYVIDLIAGLIRVDQGDRTVLDGSGPPLAFPISLSIDGGRALVTDSAQALLFGIDLTTGDRTVLSDQFIVPGAIDGDLVLDTGVPALLSVDLGTGDTATVATGFGFPRDVVRDGGRAIVVDDTLAAQLLSVDLATGTVDSLATPGLGEPSALLHDPANNRVFLIDADVAGLFVLDLSTGDALRLDGSGPPLVAPRAVSFDPSGRHLLVVDGGLGALLGVDPESGDRVVLSK